ncbi:MAG: arylsulfatase A-like enzyme [Planctomycetota bacterium]|jgi:arylsulfatase A-like enzyme
MSTWKAKFASILFACGLWHSCSSKQEFDAPDVLLISMESASVNDWGFADKAHLLGELAGRGTVFSQAIAGANWSLPSHFQMFTGLPPILHGIQEADMRLDPARSTIAELLLAGQYDTVGFHSAPELSKGHGLEDGFASYASSVQVSDFLKKEGSSDKPLFLFVQVKDQQPGLAIAKLLQHVESRGKLDNTLLILTAGCGAAGTERTKTRSFDDQRLRVPLLIVPPKNASISIDRHRHEQVSLSDILPTILDYTRVGDATECFGRSLRGPMEGGKARSKPLISSRVNVVEDEELGRGRQLIDCMRLPGEKLIRRWVRHEGEDGAQLQNIEYYNLKKDPAEERPLANFGNKRVREAWGRFEREMDLVRFTHRTMKHSPPENPLFAKRLGYAPIAPATLSGKKGSK